MEKSRKRKRMVYLCLTVLYLVAAILFTVRAQSRYREALPLVELEVIHDGLVDATDLVNSDTTGKLAVNTVEQQEGPWGKRYVIRQIELVNYVSQDTATLYLYGGTCIGAPIVISTTGPLNDGTEVRLE